MLYHVSAEWTPEDVAERFLKPCGMERLAKSFIDSNVTGTVLIALQESHLKELGCDRVGDRLTLLDYLHVSLHASGEHFVAGRKRPSNSYGKLHFSQK